jgi:hypothetical protein
MRLKVELISTKDVRTMLMDKQRKGEVTMIIDEL